MAGQKILYLDFDGVLHHEDVTWHPRRGARMRAPGERLFAHVELLVELLQPAPDLQIVLSTSWAVQYSFYGAARMLPSELRRRCVGSTWHSEMEKRVFENTSRGRQIAADLARRQPARWFAIDDNDEGFSVAMRAHLVHTDQAQGLAAPGSILEIRRHVQAMAQV